MQDVVRRMTKQKRVILDILSNTKTHPTADWLYNEARKVLPDISLGTVYRNLSMLAKTGEIRELNYSSTFSRFDANITNHYHFVCQLCGRVFDVELEPQQQLETMVARETGHQVEEHRVEFYGTCQACSASQPELKR